MPEKSDRVEQELANLTYEVTQLAVDNLTFYKRLHELNSNLVSVSDVQVAEQRVRRLRTLRRKKSDDV
jgi:hypothetical protein